jgi:hypothetical protein
VIFRFFFNVTFNTISVLDFVSFNAFGASSIRFSSETVFGKFNTIVIFSQVETFITAFADLSAASSQGSPPLLGTINVAPFSTVGVFLITSSNINILNANSCFNMVTILTNCTVSILICGKAVFW